MPSSFHLIIDIPDTFIDIYFANERSLTNLSGSNSFSIFSRQLISSVQNDDFRHFPLNGVWIALVCRQIHIRHLIYIDKVVSFDSKKLFSEEMQCYGVLMAMVVTGSVVWVQTCASMRSRGRIVVGSLWVGSWLIRFANFNCNGKTLISVAFLNATSLPIWIMYA